MVLKQAGQLLDRAEKTVLVWTILGLALIGCIQVFTRYVFNYSFTWYEELGRYLSVFIAFLGASIGVRSGGHFAMDLFVTRLASPWQQLLKCFTAVLSSVFFLLVSWYSVKIISRMYGYETTSPTMEIPMYLVYLPIPVFSAVMAVRFFCSGLNVLLELRPSGGAGEAGR